MTASIGRPSAGEDSKELHVRQPNEPVDPKSVGSGLTASAYAQQHLISETEVWRRLRRGELVGRSSGGQLLIYPAATSLTALDELPPLPTFDQDGPAPAARAGAANEGAGFLSLSGDRGQAPELALLLDHLSLAKEENREILRMTQDSIRQISRMSEQIAHMKDEVIAAKDTELATLQEKLAARDAEIRRLKQHGEDLEMLARTMVTTRHD